jgi:HK97 family phage major capsid protein
MSAIENVTKQLSEISKFSRDRVEAAEAQVEELKGRIELLEGHADRPRGGAANGDGGTADEREHKGLFLNWLRNPHDGSVKRQLDEAQAEMSKKTITFNSTTSGEGGYAMPALISQQIEQRATLGNPFRGLVRVDSVGSASYTALVSRNAMGSGWVGDGGSRSATDTSELDQVAPTFGTVYSYVSATEEALTDAFFNVEQWLVQEAGDAFAAAEATAIVSGNGSNRPSGFLNTTPATTDDDASPQRALTALEYTPMTASGSSPYALSADDLINMSLSLKDAYYMGGNVAWVMRRSTAQAIRKLKDSYNQYLLQTSLTLGMPDQLLGYPIRYTDAMPTNAAGNYPICFGNWSRGYLLADRVGTMRMTIDDNISVPGYVKFYLRRRVGGKVLNNQCLKLLKHAAS